MKSHKLNCGLILTFVELNKPMLFNSSEFLILFSASLLALYCVFICLLYFHWSSIIIFSTKQPSSDIFISVIIAARNEAQTLPSLLQSLHNQNYPSSLYEVIIIDDHSEDGTFELAKNYKGSPNLTLRVMKSIHTYGKKAAITLGIKEAKGEIILCTDADCKMNPGWLSSIAAFYKSYDAKLIFGPVTFSTEQPGSKSIPERLFADMQTIEFASLIGSGAASWKGGFPNMCNGANMSFKKDVFREVDGYSGNEQIPSGDDEFLMHKIHALYPEDVYFLKSKEALVETLSGTSLKEFYHQRMRWASKWENYTDWKVKAVALFVFLVNLGQIILMYFIASGESWKWVSFVIVFRWIAEFVFLHSTLTFMNKKINLAVYGLLVIIYPFYVVFFALAARIAKLAENKTHVYLKIRHD